MSEYKVAVLCATYNHQNYIESCIKGIIEQRTDFKFKLVIHDDASTDNTKKIIETYQKRYPSIIFPIYQTENQYSKGVKIIRDIVLPKIETPYVAICEGDDYWCDIHKLQKQYMYMESNKKCGICVHESIRVNYFENKQDLNTKEISEEDYSVEDIIRFQSGHFATNSIFIRTDILKNLPAQFRVSRFGDWQMLIYGAQNYYLHYFPDVMSVYNQGVPGSYTEKSLNLKYYIETRKEILELLDRLDNYYSYQYSGTIDTVRKSVLKRKKEAERKYYIMNNFPHLVNLGKAIRKKLKNE